MSRHFIALSLLCSLQLACAGEPGTNSPVVADIDLAAALDLADTDIVGVTVSPDEHRRYLLDRTRGLFELTDEGAAVSILPLSQFPTPEVAVVGEFTDIAALGDERFALTATNNGFLLDLRAGIMVQHFCYLPPEAEFEEPAYQVTHSLAYDSDAQMLYAQPQSFTEADDVLLDSQVGRFDGPSGQELAWFSAPDLEYLAGAIAIEDSATLLLGSGAEIDRYTIGLTWSPAADLSSYGITDITGLAIDREADTLLVVDGPQGRLLELSRAPMEP